MDTKALAAAALAARAVVEVPAGIRQDLAGAADLLLAIVGHRNTSHARRNPPEMPAPMAPDDTRKLIGRNVQNAQNETIGEIKAVYVGPDRASSSAPLPPAATIVGPPDLV